MSDAEVKPRPRREWLAFMAALSFRAGETRMGEGFLLELTACCAFKDPEHAEVLL